MGEQEGQARRPAPTSSLTSPSLGAGGTLQAGKPGTKRQLAPVNEIAEILQRGANDTWNLGLSDTQISQFVRYAEMLVEWNATRMNLTRLVSPQDIAVKHFLDSLALLFVQTPPPNARVLDVGTGAGLPGLALQIARPDLRVTLLDGTSKKLQFCRAVADDLGLEVEIVHARAEDAAKRPHLAGRFDWVTARAVAPLDKLLPWLAPFAAPTGLLLSLKGLAAPEELAAARPVAKRLGLTLSVLSVPLPEAEEETVRQIVLAQRKELP